MTKNNTAAEERARIVAWLRERARVSHPGGSFTPRKSILARQALLIERGEHWQVVPDLKEVCDDES